MKRLWAPWRLQYILGKKPKGCVLCSIAKKKTDKKNYILSRRKFSYIVLNKYPYNNGHIMVVPYKHTGDLNKLSSATLLEVIEGVTEATNLLKKAFKPSGFNVGINIGKAAGAGIEKHLHFHVVPRWEADTNFLPIMSGVRTLPDSLDNTYRKLANTMSSLRA
jgi:ATP adenylyltransferase